MSSNTKKVQSSTKKAKTVLTLEQRTKLLFSPCKTRDELKSWIKYFLSIELPDVTVSRHADSNPLDFIWEIYQICVLENNPEEIDELLAVASRGAGKTLAVAIAEILILLHDQRDVAHVGAILSQAKRCYEYQQNFLLNDRVKSVLDQYMGDVPYVEKMTQEKSIFNIPDKRTNEITRIALEVLPCTLKSVNGFHGAFVSVDEIDTLSGEGLKAFKDISGMLDSKRGRRALRVGISTRKSRYGLMNQQIENAEQAGRTVRRWTALEFSQRCPDERSGTKPTTGYYILDDMEVVSEEVWNKKDKKKQEQYSIATFPGEKCLSCPIAATCLGDAKKQYSTSPMLKPIGDAIKKTRESGADWALSQLFNLKPSVEGIIYKEFEEKLHVKDWNQMWEILTGSEYPGECTHDIFVKKCFSKDTEVLTNNGFKLFKDLTSYDTIATLDDMGRLKYQAPKEYISYHYKGDMVNIYNEIGGNGHHLDMLVTPNHDIEYLHGRNFRKNQDIAFKKIRADEVHNINDFYIPATWLTESEDKDDMESPISFMTGDQFFAFMGLWISEGSMSSMRANSEWRHNQVSVSQSKSKEASDKVDQLMSSIKWPSRLYRKIDVRSDVGYITDWSIFNKELYNYLIPMKFAVSKRIDRYILENASNRQLEILLHWLSFGDGAYMFDGSKQQPYYSTGSEQLANDVQELCFRLGYKSSISIQDNQGLVHKNTGTEYLRRFRVNFHFKTSGKPADKSYYINNGTNKSEFGGKIQSNIDLVPYDDMVYCVTMPSSRLFVRRNGVISLSGNCHQMKLSCYAGIDWGWSNPSTVVFFFVDNRENIFVVRCEGMTYTNNPTWVQMIKNKWHHMYRCQLYFPDMANPGDGVTMRTEGLPCPSEQVKDTPGGIQIVKKWLRSMASPVPKMFFAKDTCQPIITEFQMYHFKTDASGVITEDPEKEFDHWLDAIRYAMYGLFGKNKMVMADTDIDISGKLTDQYGNFNRFPSPEEFASSKGIKINPNVTQDNSKLGLIGKKSEIEDDSDGGNMDGNGGFLWSF